MMLMAGGCYQMTQLAQLDQQPGAYIMNVLPPWWPENPGSEYCRPIAYSRGESSSLVFLDLGLIGTLVGGAVGPSRLLLFFERADLREQFSMFENSPTKGWKASLHILFPVLLRPRWPAWGNCREAWREGNPAKCLLTPVETTSSNSQGHCIALGGS